MARTITLRATAKHPAREEGELYEAAGNQAMSDLYMKRAVAYKAPKIEREILHLPPERKKRRYKRRDMQAE